MVEEVEIQCPHCGEIIPISVDTSSGDYSTIEDCQVCCSPINLYVTCEPGRVDDVSVTAA